MVISVVGLGFVGLTTALAFADKGVMVMGCDNDREKVVSLKNAVIPFEEPGLEEAIMRCLNKTLLVTMNLRKCVINSDVVFFCVPTNAKEDGAVDLSLLKCVMMEAASFVPDDKKMIFVVKSTVPPTTSSGELTRLLSTFVNKSIFICSNPEFLREGCAWDDFNNAARIVIGANHLFVRNVMQDLYSGFDSPICFVTCNTAEFIKYLSNSMLATMISFANEMAMIADGFGDIEIKEAFDILHMDSRFINGQIASYIHPGCGYGGYCLPKDMQAISYAVGGNSHLLKDVIEINQKRQEYICECILNQLGTKKEVAILGLSFKPNSDDVRGAVAANIISYLYNRGVTNIYAYDPMAIKNFTKAYPDLNVLYKDSAREAIQCADVVVVLTAWEEFKKLDFLNKIMLDYRYYI